MTPAPQASGRKAAALASLLATLVAAGCAVRERAPGGETPPTSATLPFGVQELDLVLDDFRFDPSEVVIVAGSRLILNARNQGSRRHNVTIRAPGGALVVSVDVPPGETQRIDLTPQEPGAYPLYSDEMGDRALGMQGVIRVRPRP